MDACALPCYAISNEPAWDIMIAGSILIAVYITVNGTALLWDVDCHCVGQTSLQYLWPAA